MKIALSSMLGLVLVAGLGCSSDHGTAKPESTPEALVEQALQEFAAAVRDQAPVIKQLDRAITVRLTDADATVILRQYLRLIEAASRQEELPSEPEFLALIQHLADMPYFNAFAQALGPGTAVQAITAPAGAAQLASKTSALEQPSCSTDCALEARREYAQSTGLDLLGGLFDSFGQVVSGVACGDQLTALYSCLARDQCGRVELASLGSSCLQLGAAFALVATGASPLVVGAVAVSGTLVGALVSRQSVDKQFMSCQTWQEENCCIAKVTCGSGCCEQGFACLPGGICARNATAGCPDGEETCGPYCCGEGSRCEGDSGVCRPLPVCDFATAECGTSCCDQEQSCDLQGTCQACAEAARCASGSLCCQPGTFCSAIGQCLREPQGGCGALCSVACCAPGQTCSGTGLEATCLGEPAICPDETCSPGLENALVCPEDCPSQCGDGDCQDWELVATCPEDCGGEGRDDGGSGAGDASADAGTFPYDGTWTIEVKMKGCDEPATPVRTGTLTVARGQFGLGLFLTYQFMECTQTMTMTGGGVSDRGSIDGFFTFAGDCCAPKGSEDNFYGSMTSPTLGYAESYWALVTLRRQ